MKQLRDVSLIKKLIRVMTNQQPAYGRKHTQKLHKKYYKQMQSTAPWNRQFGDEFQKDTFAFDALRSIATDQYDDRNKLLRYIEFDAMEFTPEVSAAINIIATEMTHGSSTRPVLNIECKKPEILEILNDLYFNTLAIQSNAFGWARNTIKYGDYYLYLELDAERGVVGTRGVHPKEMKRIEGLDPLNPNYYKFEMETTRRQYESIEFAHFRIKGDERYTPYGTSVLEGARRVVRQLTLLEDNAMGYRIVRSPERRVFYIDVTTIPDEKVKEYMEKLKTSLKRSQVINATTGAINERFNPPAIDEDYYIPIRGKSQTKIETLPGGQYNGAIDDLKYFQNKLFTILMVPQDYLSYEKGGGGDKALSEKNIYFAGQIFRLQQDFAEVLVDIGRLHLTLLGYRGEDIVDWVISLNNPSRIADMQDLALWKEKLAVASAAGLEMTNFLSKRWICEKLFNIKENEFIRIQRELEYDKRFDAKLEALGKGADAEGGSAGDSLGGAVDAGMESAAENGGEIPDGESEGADSMLLTAPGRRDTNKPHLTDGAKGKEYTYTNHSEHGSGAFNRHMLNGLGSMEKGGVSKRNVGIGISEAKINELMAKIEKVVKKVKETPEATDKTNI